MLIKKRVQTKEHIKNRVESLLKNGKRLNVCRGKKIVIDDKKWCNVCKKWKVFAEFDKDSSRRLGITSKCKTCNYIYKNNHKEQVKYFEYKSRAKRKGKEFGLSKSEFLKFWQKPCSYCGDKIETIGIDRTDSSKGYLIGNIISCCAICNAMKLALPREVFIKHCYKIIKYYGNQ